MPPRPRGHDQAEGAIGIAAALLAGSSALLGFGVDSGVESLSGVVLLWRLAAERRGADEAAAQAQSQDEGAADGVSTDDLRPFDRGPEITEIR